MKKFLKIFGFRSEVNSMQTEVFSGFSTFIVMAYILALAPVAYQNIGTGNDKFPVDSLMSSIAIVSALSCTIMAVWAKRPLCLAPGIGLLYFITGTVCVNMGYSWHFALTAVFLEGLIFTILSFTGIRTLVVETIPLSLRSGIGVGVGFFLASLGMKNGNMLNSHSDFLTIVSMLTEPSKQLMGICIIISGILLTLRVRGAIFISIIVSTIIGIPMGQTHLDTLIKIPESPAPLFCQMEWSSDIFSVDMVVCVISILFLDVFDTVGTSLGVLSNTKLARPSGRISGMSRILQADAIASVLSGLFGTSTCTTYLESAVGVASGGRTGITPLVTAICFILALFISPLFLAIPSSVTGAVLLIVSVQMFTAVKHINFTNPVEAIPSILTILIMAILGSISDGIVVGVLTYAIFYFVSDMAKQYKNHKNNSIFNLDE